MNQIPVKRTYDDRVYDFICSNLLPTGATVSSVVSVTDDQNQFTYGTPVVNTAAITYADLNLTAAIGTVVQVKIGGGTIPANKMHLTCTIRVKFTTSDDQDLEATAELKLSDTV